MNGGEGCENGAESGKLRRCIARQMRHGALQWSARRDRRPRDGRKCFPRGFYGGLQEAKSQEPSVGDAESVSVLEPRLGQFLASSALLVLVLV